jgi:hypothetical protein
MAGNYVNGVIPSIGNRIAKYTFGSKLHKFEFNKEENEFHVFLKQEVAKNIVDHFKKHWPGFKIFVITTQEE